MMQPPTSRRRLRWLAGVPSIAWVLLALLLLFSIIAPHFATVDNAFNLMRQGAVLMIVSCGMMVAIANAGIDLSVGSLIGLSGVMIAFTLQRGFAWPAAILAAIGVCALAGLISGLIIAKGRIFPFVVTFGMLFIARSVSLGISSGGSIHIDSPTFSMINEGYWLRLPIPFWLTITVILGLLLLLRWTVFGPRVFSIGSSSTSAGWMGINVDRYRAAVYVLTGTLAGIAGVILASRINTGNANIGQGTEFLAIAAVIIGGTSFDGGRGSLAGAALGALVITALENGMSLLGFSSELRSASVGLALMLGVILAQSVYKGAPSGT